MLLPMLKAVEKMLPKPDEPLELSRTRVLCAREILSQIILNLEQEETHHPKLVFKEAVQLGASSAPQATVSAPANPAKVEPLYQASVDVDNKLMEIKNLPMDAMVEIDGKVMTHKEAIGRKFMKGKIL